MFDEIGIPYCKTEIHRRAINERSALQGKIINALKDGEKSWSEFSALGKEIYKK